MTIVLDRSSLSTPHTTPHTSSRTAPRTTSHGGVRLLSPTASAPETGQGEELTVTLTVTLPAGTRDVEAALLADTLRAQARRAAGPRGARASVRIDNAGSASGSAGASAGGTARAAAQGVGPTAPRALHPLPGGAAGAPLRPRRAGIVSPNSPARRDAEAARRRVLRATAVSPASPSDPAAASGLVVDLYGRRLRIDGEDIALTHKEFELLAHLVRRSRHVVSRQELMGTVWADADTEIGERTVDVHVRRLRSKLGRYRRLISTVRGSGYRVDPGSDVAVLG